MKAIWINDVHLEFLDDVGRERFLDDLRRHHADCVLLGGDIAQAPTVCQYLAKLDSDLQYPIYFVLGNHDFYHGSISSVRSAIVDLQKRSTHLCWLGGAGVVKLTSSTSLVGHDGWGDARLGDFDYSDVLLNDFLLIEELAGLSRNDLRHRLQSLGKEAAEHLYRLVPQALETSDHVIVLTHVPPFLEASWHEGRFCNGNWLPFFACKAVGDVLKEAMLRHPYKRMTVLCGHTHGGGTSHILPNLVAHTGPAEYGQPSIQRVFEWD
jgi:predicted MPP superfamily phosphohydrolase